MAASISRQRAMAIGFLPFLVGAATICGCGKAPQIAGNEKSLKAADALLTAISAKSPSLLEQCEANLATLRAADELSQPAHDYLQSVIVEARSGEWVTARRRLVKLIKSQTAPP